jgi:arylamine N-acetyltransferase
MSIRPLSSPQTVVPRQHRSKQAEDVLRRYQLRLGVDTPEPSTTALAELHRAHVERIPYETFWLHLNQPWGITLEESLHHIAVEGRGGYCFHLNPAFGELLDWLGYTVVLHPAGVHDSNGPDCSTIGNHVALTVHDLADDSNPDGTWYLDTGLGDGLHEPIPLHPGVYPQGPTTFTINGTDGVGDWSLHPSPADSYAGVSIIEQLTTINAFGDRHHFNSTSPQSSFATTVTAQRRSADGADILRGCVLTTRRDTTTTRTFDNRDDWLDALDKTFGLRFSVSHDALDRLWSQVRAAHQAWNETSAERSLTGPPPGDRSGGRRRSA